MTPYLKVRAPGKHNTERKNIRRLEPGVVKEFEACEIGQMPYLPLVQSLEISLAVISDLLGTHTCYQGTSLPHARS